jgi:hypothetical protein
MFRKFYIAALMGVMACLGVVSQAMAAISLPTLPVTDLESGAATVLGFVAVFVGISMLLRLFKKA